MMRALLLTAVLLVTACKSEVVRQNPRAPDAILVPVDRYVPIPPEMTARCKWPKEGTPSQVFDHAKARAVCLQKYEAQFDRIEAVEGSPVPDSPAK